ncbi:MAG: hypothetical protein AB1325_02975 [Nitrospirota bacterium]
MERLHSLNFHMKIKSILVLIAIIVSIASPFHPAVSYASDSNGTKIFTLDVCNASSPSLSVNADMPFVYECPCKHISLGFASFYEGLNPVFNTFLVVFQKEYPPEV